MSLIGTPRVHYLDRDGTAIAYQVVEGAPGGQDVLYVPPYLSELEHLWEHPQVAQSLRRLAGMGRLITFDRRGVGLSDGTTTRFTLEDEVLDVLAVLDAAAAESVSVVTQISGGDLACLLSATRPERVRSLVLHSCFARLTWAPDYDWAARPVERRASMEAHLSDWGQGHRTGRWAPSWQDDPVSRRWLAGLERRTGSPSTVIAINEVMNQSDVRPALPAITCPTLVMRRRDDTFVDRRHAVFLAGAIPDARLVELEGADAFAFAGDADDWVDRVGEFVTGRPPPGPVQRVLRTLLFTDIVASTSLLARVGDERWRAIRAEHDRLTGRALAAHGGEQIKHTGDGLLASFEAPGRALRCALTMVDDLRAAGLELRAGVHLGEFDVVGSDIAGRTVHEAARIAALAGAGQVLTSEAVRGLVAGSELAFHAEGRHVLRGFDGELDLHSVTHAAV